MNSFPLRSQYLKIFLPFIVPSIIFLVLIIFFKFNGLYGQDSHEYYRYSRDIITFLNGGPLPLHFHWPVFYPICGALFSFVIPDLLFTLQLISFLSLIFSIYFIQKILKLIGVQSGNNLTIYLLTALSLSPFMIIYSSAVMTDMFSIFFITGAVFFFFKYSDSSKAKYFYLFVFFSGSAFMTRYAAAVILIIPVLIILKKLFIPLRKEKLVLIPFAVVISFICIFPHFYLKSGTTYAVTDLSVRHWDTANFLYRSFSTSEGFSSSIEPNIVFAFSNLFHPYYIFFGIILLFFIRKADWNVTAVRLSILILILFAIFMAGFPFQNKRHLLLSFPFVIIILYNPFNRALAYLKNRQAIKTSVIIILCLVQLLIFSYAFNKIYELNRIEKNISAAISGYDNEVIYTFFIDPALHTYGVNKIIINMWDQKINSFQKNGLVLFNVKKFKEQWKDKNPLINWNKIKNNYRLTKLQSFDDGWELYEIE